MAGSDPRARDRRLDVDPISRKKNSNLLALKRSSERSILPHVRLGKVDIHIFPAHQGPGFDLLLAFAGASVVIENVTFTQVRKIVGELERFSK